MALLCVIRFLTEAEPWKMKGEELATRRQAIVRTSLEAVYAFMHFLAPVMPLVGQQVFTCLNTSPRSIHNLRNDFYNLAPGTPITVGNILFQKILTEAEKPASVPTAPVATKQTKQAKPAKQSKKPKENAQTEEKEVSK